MPMQRLVKKTDFHVLSVQLQHFFDVVAVVAQARHFVLAAELAFLLEPVVEQAGAGGDDFEGLQGDVLGALGFVVGVESLERVVQHLGEVRHAIGHLGELDEPLVAAFGVAVHEDGGGRVFQDLGAGGLAGFFKPFLGVVHDEFLAECVDEVLGAPGDDELVGAAGGEPHGVAYHVAPQAAGGADEHGVVLSRFHAFEGDGGGAGLACFFEGEEFVEHAIVRHEQEGGVGGVVLYAEEAF